MIFDYQESFFIDITQTRISRKILAMFIFTHIRDKYDKQTFDSHESFMRRLRILNNKNRIRNFISNAFWKLCLDFRKFCFNRSSNIANLHVA